MMVILSSPTITSLIIRRHCSEQLLEYLLPSVRYLSLLINPLSTFFVEVPDNDTTEGIGMPGLHALGHRQKGKRMGPLLLIGHWSLFGDFPFLGEVAERSLDPNDSFCYRIGVRRDVSLSSNNSFAFCMYF